MNNLYKNLKKALGITAVAAVALCATSCEDLLDTKPQGTFSEDQIGDDECVALMTAAYAGLLNHFIGNNEAFAGPITNWVFDVRSDDAVKGGDGVTMEGYIHQMEIGNIQSNSDTGNFKWQNNYYSISRCNTALKGILNAGNISETARDQYASEMKVLRAFFYFDLLRIFQRFPYIDDETPNPSEVPAGNLSKDEILAKIKADLAHAYQVLPETQPIPGRFNRYVAAALMARVCCWTGSWAEVENYANAVIGSGQYQLYPFFQDMSKPEYNNMYEAVMSIQFSSANEPDQYNWSNLINCTWSEGNLYGNGDDFYLGSQNLANAFRTDANGLPMLDGSYNNRDVTTADFNGNVDPRLDFTLGRIDMPWRGNTYTRLWCRNFSLYGQFSGKKPYTAPDSPYCKPGILPWGASTLNWSIIRYADVLLMKAEALIEQGKELDTARQLINDIRRKAKRSMDVTYVPADFDPTIATYKVEEYPSTGWNQDYARKAVRMERRLELAMEGNRWFDLVRWGIAVETMNNYYQTEARIHTYYDGANLTADEIYLPIPVQQVDISGGLYQ